MQRMLNDSTHYIPRWLVTWPSRRKNSKNIRNICQWLGFELGWCTDYRCSYLHSTLYIKRHAYPRVRSRVTSKVLLSNMDKDWTKLRKRRPTKKKERLGCQVLAFYSEVPIFFYFKHHSHLNCFYCGRQCLWTLTSSNSMQVYIMQSVDCDRK